MTATAFVDGENGVPPAVVLLTRSTSFAGDRRRVMDKVWAMAVRVWDTPHQIEVYQKSKSLPLLTTEQKRRIQQTFGTCAVPSPDPLPGRCFSHYNVSLAAFAL
jgi:hypothetical protein